MARIKITVLLDVDLDEFRAEYGEEDKSQHEIREHIRTDIQDALSGAPYSDALTSIETK